jgi:hypothetical protein
LVQEAKTKDPTLGNGGIELRKPTHRARVATALASPSFTQDQLSSLFTRMHDLCGQLSETQFGKIPMNSNIQLLETYYNEWIAILNLVAGIYEIEEDNS